MPRVITFCEFGFSQRIRGGQQIDDENRNLLASLSRVTETDKVNLREITNLGEERYKMRSALPRRRQSCYRTLFLPRPHHHPVIALCSSRQQSGQFIREWSAQKGGMDDLAAVSCWRVLWSCYPHL